MRKNPPPGTGGARKVPDVNLLSFGEMPKDCE